MNICMISDDFIPSATGVGVHLKIVTQKLVNQGHKVVVVTSRQTGQPAQEVWNGVIIYRLFSINTFGFWQVLALPSTLRRIFEQEKITVVHHHYLGSLMFSAYFAAKRLQLQQLLTFHMGAEHVTQPLPMRPLRPVVHALYMWLCRHMSLILVPATGLVDFLKQNNVHVPTEYLSNPVDMPLLNQSQINGFQPTMPASFSTHFNILYVGRLNREKNVQLLVRAFAELQAKHPQAVLWIAGKGDQKNTLEKMCAKLGIADKVHFLGFIEHEALAKLYKACDVFVLPSIFETQGLVAMEAMLYSKPVIVTDKIVSATDLVEPGINGFIVDPNESGDLARRLEQLLMVPELGQQMGRSGFSKTLQYKPDFIVNRLSSYYTHLADNRKKDYKNI